MRVSKGEQMNRSAYSHERALNEKLMEKICDKDNLNKALKHVKSKKGAPGIDNQGIEETAAWMHLNKDKLIQDLMNGTYKPAPIKRVEIPKSDGKGTRKLGIPTILDRIIQQAILQIIDPIFDPHFSEMSDGFRKKRGTHTSLNKAKLYVQEGYKYVVDIDLENFFDRVNHDMIMARIARRIGDKRLLKLIRSYLQSGIIIGDSYQTRLEGTPQGGPLSPLLSNILLDDLDKELERRGHKFVRYADDCNIYVRSKISASRVLVSVSNFIERKLKLVVNKTKSKACHVNMSTYLGYTIKSKGRMIASKESIKRFKSKIKLMTRRNCGRKMENVISNLNQMTSGWMRYFCLDGRTRIYQDLDSWIRRRLRCLRLKQRKRTYSIATWLIKLGILKIDAWKLAKSSKGWWRLSKTPQLHMSLNNAWFSSLGLLSLHKERVRLQN